MTTRRQFLGRTAAMAGASFATPALSLAAPLAPTDLPEEFRAQIVQVTGDFARGEVHVIAARHFLYCMLGDGQAVRYGVALGPETRALSGHCVVGHKAGAATGVAAGALHLHRGGRDTAPRIHAAEASSAIGRAAAAGCIGMAGDHLDHLRGLVPLGARVTVHS